MVCITFIVSKNRKREMILITWSFCNYIFIYIYFIKRLVFNYKIKFPLAVQYLLTVMHNIQYIRFENFKHVRHTSHHAALLKKMNTDPLNLTNCSTVTFWILTMNWLILDPFIYLFLLYSNSSNCQNISYYCLIFNYFLLIAPKARFYFLWVLLISQTIFFFFKSIKL